MKTTLFFKRADCYIQLASVVLPVLLSLCYSNAGFLVICPILLGILQPASCLLNAFLLDEFIKQPERSIYWKALVGVIAALLLAIALDNAFAKFLSMLIAIASPIMAILYFVISWREMRFITMQVDRKQYV